MKMTRWKKSLSFIVCIVLIAAMALILTGCNDSNDTKADPTTEAPTSSSSSTAATGDNETPATDPTDSQSNVLGEGETEFNFTVTDADGNETAFVIRTDKQYVGEALMDVGLIDGEDGPYGLYVKTVNGITVDYDTDGKYWAFYENGEYAMTGVDFTEITEGGSYAFVVE